MQAVWFLCPYPLSHCQTEKRNLFSLFSFPFLAPLSVWVQVPGKLWERKMEEREEGLDLLLQQGFWGCSRWWGSLGRPLTVMLWPRKEEKWYLFYSPCLPVCLFLVSIFLTLAVEASLSIFFYSGYSFEVHWMGSIYLLG